MKIQKNSIKSDGFTVCVGDYSPALLDYSSLQTKLIPFFGYFHKIFKHSQIMIFIHC